MTTELAADAITAEGLRKHIYDMALPIIDAAIAEAVAAERGRCIQFVTDQAYECERLDMAEAVTELRKVADLLGGTADGAHAPGGAT